MDGVIIVYKGSSITLDEIMYLNKKKKREQKQSPKQWALPIKVKLMFLGKCKSLGRTIGCITPNLGIALGHFIASVIHNVDVLRTRLQHGAFSGEGKLKRIKVQVWKCFLSINTKILIGSCIVTV